MQLRGKLLYTLHDKIVVIDTIVIKVIISISLYFVDYKVEFQCYRFVFLIY